MHHRLRPLLLRLMLPALLMLTTGCVVAIQGAGTGSGSVTFDTGIVGSPNVCVYQGGPQVGDCWRLFLRPGLTIQLTATAANGSTFSGWTGCDSVSGAQDRDAHLHPQSSLTRPGPIAPPRGLSLPSGGAGSRLRRV
jgi:hypothetical protein